MNSLFTRIAFLIAFVTVGFGANAQSINSTLNNRPGVTVGVNEDFTVTLSPGALSPFTNVKLAIVLTTPAQSADINLSLQNPQTLIYEPLVFDGSGNSISAAGPYFLVGTFNLKVTFDAAGTYNYSLRILDGTTNAILANSNESVVVTAPLAAPSISSSLNGQTVLTGAQTTYGVSTTTGGYAGTLIKVFFKMNPAQVANTNIQYFEVQSGTWQPFQIGVNGEAIFGPSTGFPLNAATTQFRVTYNAAGVYNYKLSVFRAAAPNDTLAIANESVTVVNPAPPTIFSSVAGDTLTTGVQTPYSVSTTTGDYAGTMVRVFFKMSPSQVANGVTEYYEPQLSAWIPFTVNANGEALFGPTAGFPLAATSSQFRVTYNTPGVYDYKMAIIRASNPSDTLAIANEYVVVEDPELPTISSNLPSFSPVLSGAQTSYAVTTDANDYAGTMVRVFFEVLNPAQAADVNILYEATPGNYLPLVIDANGEGSFGPGAGFPLGNLSTNFKITFDAAGVYTYKMSLYEVGSNDTLASATESVTVVDYIAPTIASTLNGQTLDVAEEADFLVTTTDGSEAGTLVRVFFKLNNAAQTNDVNIQYEVTAGTFAPLTLNANGEAFFGPVGGFPLGDVSTNFKATFDAAGVYGYKMYIVEVASTDTLASATESVTVVVPIPTTPEISSDLDERPNVVVNEEELFTVTTIKNNAANANVRIKITLENPAQADSIDLQFENPASGAFEQLSFDANGVAYAGNVGGFALANADYDFKVSFIGGGLYAYNLALVNVAGNTELANNDEEVYVLDNSGIEENNSIIVNAFPNPTSGNISIQTKANGIGNLDVFSITGKKVMNQTINGSTNIISMETLPAGLYIVRISQGGNEAVIRVVKN